MKKSQSRTLAIIEKFNSHFSRYNSDKHHIHNTYSDRLFKSNGTTYCNKDYDRLLSELNQYQDNNLVFA